jgi:hypothetical protein
MKLSKELKNAVEYHIHDDFREEAKTILMLTTDEYKQEFLEYHEKNKGNICCLVLDFAKRDLVKEKKMIQNENDAFGKLL